MSEITNTYGLLLRKEPSKHGAYPEPYFIAEIVKREGNHHAPRNCSDGVFSENRPAHLADLYLSGLRMRGFVGSGGGAEFIGFEPCYYDTYAVRERDARRMLKTLSLINKRITKDAAYSAADCFAALCVALRLSFVVECCDDKKAFSSCYDDSNWRWLSIGEGRNLYRHHVETMQAAALAALAEKAA